VPRSTRDGHTGGANELWLDLRAHSSSEVTRRLVERGIDVVSFAPRETSLEEIYLRHAHARADAPGALGADAKPPGAKQSTTKQSTAKQSTADQPSANQPSAWPDAPAAPVILEPRERIAPPRPRARMAAFDLRRHAGSIALLALLASPALIAVLRVLQRKTQASANQAEIEAGQLFSTTEVNAFEALGLALQAGLPLLAFLMLGLGSQSLAAEYARGTLRNVLLRPLRRLDCALGKLAALTLIMLAGYAFLVAVSFAVVAALFRFTDVAEVLPNGQRFLLTPASQMWGPLRTALIAPIPALAAYTALGFLAGAIARTGAGALSVALGLGVFLDLARAFTRSFGAAGALPSDHLPSPLSDTSFLSYYVDLVTGVSNVRFDHPLASVVVPLAWALCAFALSARILDRRAIP
jgi:hypothetical protein